MTTRFLSDLVTEKRCRDCGEKKPLGEFYRQPSTNDGHMGRCKVCTRARVAAHRAAHLDEIRAYDRRRANEPHRRVHIAHTVAAWRQRFPAHARAQSAMNNAVRDGRLQRATACQVCQTPGRVEAHHHDYTQPLDVLWVCKPCHWHADDVRRLQEAVAHGI